MQWVRFFVGTPQRFLATMVVPLLVFAYFRPDIIQTAIFNLVNAVLSAVAPFVQPLLTLALVFFGLAIMIRAVWRR